MNISLIPEYPIPNKPTQLVFLPSNPSCNFIKAWVTVAPTDSSLDKKIKSAIDQRTRVEVFSNTPGIDFPFNTTFDKGGKYTFVIQEYKKGSGYGGGYEGDPDGGDLEQKLGAEQTIFVYVGQRMTQVIGPPSARATINVWVWDNTIRQTFKSIHGEDTPSITATPSSDRIKSAIESSSVKAALLNLVGVSCSTAIGFMNSFVPNYFDKWTAHLSNATYHNAVDTFNKLDSSLKTAYSPNSLKDFVNKAIFLQKLHFLNDNSLDHATALTGAVVGPGLATFHDLSDRTNLCLYSSVGNFDEAYGAMVDLIRCYEAHRSASGVHNSNDSVNGLLTMTPLMLVHNAYLSVIASDNPVAPSAQSTGAQILISAAGFKEG